MVRVQIQLTKEQVRASRERARQEGRSIADLVRASVSEYLATRWPADRREHVRRARRLTGRFRSGRAELASEHDRYLEGAFGP